MSDKPWYLYRYSTHISGSWLITLGVSKDIYMSAVSVVTPRDEFWYEFCREIRVCVYHRGIDLKTRDLFLDNSAVSLDTPRDMSHEVETWVLYLLTHLFTSKLEIYFYTSVQHLSTHECLEFLTRLEIWVTNALHLKISTLKRALKKWWISHPYRRSVKIRVQNF